MFFFFLKSRKFLCDFYCIAVRGYPCLPSTSTLWVATFSFLSFVYGCSELLPWIEDVKSEALIFIGKLYFLIQQLVFQSIACTFNYCFEWDDFNFSWFHASILVLILDSLQYCKFGECLYCSVKVTLLKIYVLAYVFLLEMFTSWSSNLNLFTQCVHLAVCLVEKSLVLKTKCHIGILKSTYSSI